MRKSLQLTESIFLDELAEGIVKAGKARYVEREYAIHTLEKYPKNPLIVRKNV